MNEKLKKLLFMLHLQEIITSMHTYLHISEMLIILNLPKAFMVKVVSSNLNFMNIFKINEDYPVLLINSVSSQKKYF